MLFNSPEFLFLFLPITLLLFLAGQKLGRNAALISLGAASFFFYGWWDFSAIPILLTSIILNWFAGELINKNNEAQSKNNAKIICGLAIIANLLVLIYYKYSAFIVNDLINPTTGSNYQYTSPLLPIGVSFFTFTQIAYLVDMYSEKAKRYSPIHYALFVNYFPHLIAGPILHHAEMMPQFEAAKNKTDIINDLSIGTGILLIGLGKKLLLADPLGGYVNIFYATIAESKTTPGFFESITVSLAYSFQLYFDFSGYSDMAIGISRMFGINLPINFNSPYKSHNIIEFWRRWHISLSTFLRDYLYIPLGGSKKGEIRRFANLFTTMLLGGIWHGAGWTFILWGAIHGALLIINHAFHASMSRIIPASQASGKNIFKITSITVTFACVNLAWIPFRAPDIETATAVLTGILGLNGATLPSQILAMAPFLGTWITSAGNVPLLADGTVMGFIEMSTMILIGICIAFFPSNTQEMTNRSRLLIGAIILPLLTQKIFFGGKVEFLYFQF